MRALHLHLCACFILLVSLSFAQTSSWEVRHFNTSDGLSSDRVFCIAQDPWGFIWAGTEEGASRWDGYTFTSFVPSLFDTSSAQGLLCSGLSVGLDSSIWLATAWGGPYRYNPVDYPKSKPFNFERKDGLGINGTECYNVFADREGRVWAGSAENVERWLGPGKGFKSYLDGQTKGRMDMVKGMVQDREGTIWIAFRETGLFSYVAHADSFIFHPIERVSSRISHLLPEGDDIWIVTEDSLLIRRGQTQLVENFNQQHPFPEAKPGFSSIFIDSKKQLWIGTQSGLWYWDIEKNQFIQVKLPPKNLDSPSKGSALVTSIIEDSNQDLWIGTFDGVFQLIQQVRKFQNVISPQGEGLDGREFAELADGSLWIGYGSGCPEKYPPTSDTSGMPSVSPAQVFCEAFDDHGKAISIAGSSRMLACEDTTFWCSNGRQGLFHLKEVGDKLHILESWDTERLGGNPLGVSRDRDGNLWLRMLGTVLRLEKQSDGTSWDLQRPIPDSIQQGLPRNAIFFDFLQDRRGDIYLASNADGIFRFQSDGRFDRLLHYDLYDESSFPNPGALSMAEDSLGRIWFGEYGIYMYDPKADTSAHYGLEIGLPSMYIASIVIDKKNRLWAHTTKGISKVDISTLSVQNFKDQTFLGGTGNSAGVKQNGEIWIGRQNGFLSFHPDSLIPYSPPPSVIITDFQLSGKSIPQRGKNEANTSRVSLERSLLDPLPIILPYDETDISLTFTALHFKDPQANLFKYKLQGYDKDWRLVDSRNRKATYTNLPPNTYTFQVLAANHAGIWSEKAASLTFTIPPPPWLSLWAKAAYALLAALLIWIVFRVIRERVRMRRAIWLEQVEKKRNAEIRDMQSRLYTNVSHEFRTPLTLIQGPLEQLEAAEKDPGKKELLSMAHSNTGQLQLLIDQLLDIARLDVQKMPFHYKDADIAGQLRLIHASFSSLAESQDISFPLHTSVESYPAHYDPDKINKIFNNLIGNALKFTPQGGQVSFSADITQGPEGPVLQASVTDSGPGIEPVHQARIFERFYQTDSSMTRSHGGTGIGLALTREIIELLQGSIFVESQSDSGTVFRVEIPLKAPISSPPMPDEQQRGAEEVISAGQKMDKIWEHAGTAQKPRILVVEDHPDMNRYISQLLADSYEVIHAFNGKEGLEMAQEHFPDAVISDVMMPEMDGFEFTARLKQAELSSHIPVLLLTAKSGTDSKVSGFSEGADQYLTKPFEKEELLTRLAALLMQRQRLRTFYTSVGPFLLDQLAPSPRDLKFIQKLKNTIEANYANNEFNVTELHELMGMGHRMALQRKLKALFQTSPGHFLRDFRLRKAAELLLSSDDTIEGIAFQVGFGSHSIFSRNFKEVYEVTPKAYRERKLGKKR